VDPISVTDEIFVLATNVTTSSRKRNKAVFVGSER